MNSGTACWCLWNMFLFICIINLCLPPGEWWKKKKVVYTWSAFPSGAQPILSGTSFHNPESDEGKGTLGDEDTSVYGEVLERVCLFLRERYKIALFCLSALLSSVWYCLETLASRLQPEDNVAEGRKACLEPCPLLTSWPLLKPFWVKVWYHLSPKWYRWRCMQTSPYLWKASGKLQVDSDWSSLRSLLIPCVLCWFFYWFQVGFLSTQPIL